jgi:hypothetical protein
MLPLQKHTASANRLNYLMVAILTLLSISVNAQEKSTKKMLFGSNVATAQIPSFQGFYTNSMYSNTKPSLGKPELDAQLAAIQNATSMQWLIDSLNRDNMEKSKAFTRIIIDGKVIEYAKLDSIIQQKKRNQSPK